MLVRLIRDCTGPNPKFDPKAKLAAEQAGEHYGVPHTIVLPEGTEIEHPQAAIHCVPGFRNEPPKAEPLDDQAKAATERLLQARERGLNRLKAVLKMPPPKDPKARRALHETAEAYGLDRQGNPVEPESPESEDE